MHNVNIKSILKPDDKRMPEELQQKAEIKEPRHIHMLQRFKRGKQRGYRCVHPDCAYFTDRVLLLGKRSLCNRCGQEFILDQFALELAKPCCAACSKNKKRQPTREFDFEGAVTKMFKEQEG